MTVMLDPAAEKASLRKAAAKARKAAQQAQPDAAQKLADQASKLVNYLEANIAAPIIAGYWPIRSEIDPRSLMTALEEAGCKLALPVTPQEGQPLSFHLFDGPDSLQIGPYDTRQPDPSSPAILPDLILAPLLAFDEGCWRLGYGGGFYDRTLSQLESLGKRPKVIGLAFDAQQVEGVPTGPYDQPLDAILTPSKLMIAKQATSGLSAGLEE